MYQTQTTFYGVDNHYYITCAAIPNNLYGIAAHFVRSIRTTSTDAPHTLYGIAVKNVQSNYTDVLLFVFSLQSLYLVYKNKQSQDSIKESWLCDITNKEGLY